jgi:hypothetical protein
MDFCRIQRRNQLLQEAKIMMEIHGFSFSYAELNNFASSCYRGKLRTKLLYG